MGFWPSETLLSAVEPELFTKLGRDSMTGEQLGERLGRTSDVPASRTRTSTPADVEILPLAGPASAAVPP